MLLQISKLDSDLSTYMNSCLCLPRDQRASIRHILSEVKKIFAYDLHVIVPTIRVCIWIDETRTP